MFNHWVAGCNGDETHASHTALRLLTSLLNRHSAFDFFPIGTARFRIQKLRRIARFNRQRSRRSAGTDQFGLGNDL